MIKENGLRSPNYKHDSDAKEKQESINLLDYYFKLIEVSEFNLKNFNNIIIDIRHDIWRKKENSTSEEYNKFTQILVKGFDDRINKRLQNTKNEDEKINLNRARNQAFSSIMDGLFITDNYKNDEVKLERAENNTLNSALAIMSDKNLYNAFNPYKANLYDKCVNFISHYDSELHENDKINQKDVISNLINFLTDLDVDDLMFTRDNIYCLSAILNKEPDFSASLLLSRLKNSTEKEHISYWSDLLYRLEFGQISINKGSVKYLEKTYKISDKQADSVHRITASGDIGLFDEENKLQNYFNLGDLSTKEKIIEPEVKEIDQNALFHEPKLNDAEREKQIEEFKTHYLEFYSNDFFKKTGIRFNNLDLKEQCWFFFATKNNSEEKQAELYIFAKKCGERGLKSFISFEIGGTAMGEKILLIGNSLPERNANMFFDKLADLYDFAEKENKELAELLYKDGNQSSIWQMRQHLLQKAHDRIIEFSDKLSTANAETELTKVISDIENIKTEITLLVSVIRTAKEEEKEGTDGKKFDLNNLQGLDLTLKNIGDNITPEQAKKMVSMARRNWQGNPDKGAVISSLEKALNQPQKNKFYSLDYQGELAAFVRYEELKPAEPEIGQRGRLYAGSRNAHIETRGLAVAKHLIEKVHFLEAENNIIDALIESGNPDVSTQVEQFGFVIVGLEKSATATDFKISCDMRKNNLYQYRNDGLPKNPLVSPEVISEQAKSISEIKNEKAPAIIVKVDLPKENVQLTKLCERLLPDKKNTGEYPDYHITRYFKNPEKPTETIIVFEKQK